MAEGTVEIRNKLGLHLRAATMLVKTAGKFSSVITLWRGKEHANARSVIALMTLGAGLGARLTVKAEGSDAEQALKAVEALFNDKFGEE
ncbi:MAG TPA: HPr family phosphocarrier protein [Candidatus Binataceae bacterium]|nr:HPr family phosphocarrier protein [Candidatus Binataceae bacterium]